MSEKNKLRGDSRTFGLIILLIIMMSAIQVNYYAVSYLATSIGGNKFINCAISGFAEVLACLVTGFMLARVND